MKQLLNHPFLLAVFLSLPLWILLGNYLVALIAALLVAFLLSMYNALRSISRRKKEAARQDTKDPE